MTWRRAIPHSRQAPVVVSLCAAVLVAGVTGLVWRSVTMPVAAAPTTTTTTTTTLPPTTTTIPQPQVPVATELAVTHGDIPTFDGPGGAAVGTTGHWYGHALTLPVLLEQGAWLQVRIPVRPNGSTAWVRSSDVDLGQTPYRIVISQTTTHLTVYQAGFPILSFPVGLGREQTPTPLGSFFVGIAEGPVPGYGPVVLDLSAHSEAIQSWQGSGDAVIAIHGPFGADAQIADTGTFVSNGCIRMHEADQVQLGFIQAGTPVDIVA